MKLVTQIFELGPQFFEILILVSHGVRNYNSNIDLALVKVHFRKNEAKNQKSESLAPRVW